MRNVNQSIPAPILKIQKCNLIFCPFSDLNNFRLHSFLRLNATYTNSMKVSFPTTGMNEKRLRSMQLAAQASKSGFARWFLVEERKGHKAIPSNGMLSIHL